MAFVACLESGWGAEECGMLMFRLAGAELARLHFLLEATNLKGADRSRYAPRQKLPRSTIPGPDQQTSRFEVL